MEGPPRLLHISRRPAALNVLQMGRRDDEGAVWRVGYIDRVGVLPVDRPVGLDMVAGRDVRHFAADRRYSP